MTNKRIVKLNNSEFESIVKNADDKVRDFVYAVDHRDVFFVRSLTSAFRRSGLSKDDGIAIASLARGWWIEAAQDAGKDPQLSNKWRHAITKADDIQKLIQRIERISDGSFFSKIMQRPTKKQVIL